MTFTHFRPARPVPALLLSASALAIATPAAAAEIVFATDRTLEVETGERTSQISGLTQLRLDTGAVLSFVDSAEYRLNADGSVDLYAGTVTVAGADGAETVIRMPDGVEGRVSGGAAASFSVGADGLSRGHALTGNVTVQIAGNSRSFEAGELWAADDDRLRQVVSNGSAATPDEGEVAVADMEQGGPLAAAENGLPVSLGDALAAAGASGDVLAAARRVEAAAGNPDLATFPTGDLAMLVSYSVQLQNAYGGQAFPGAQADVIRAYLGFLADGGAGANFLTAYSGILVQYLDLLRAGALPSSFEGASVADINAFIGYAGRTSGFGSLSAQNRALIDAYLAFLTNGGEPDLFVRSYTDLITAYFAFLRAGGDPLDFQGASQQTLAAYIGFLSQSGLSAQLSAADRALIQAYLANGGLAFTSQYRAALDTYFAFLNAGNLPSDYTGLDAATLRAYLEALQSTGLFDQVLGARAEFYAAFLAHLRAGGAIDAFAGLNANIFAGYSTQLAAYYEFLLQGGQPSQYTLLTQQQIAAYLAALQAAGASGVFLDDLAEFYSGYFAYLNGGGDPDFYTGLPALNLPGFADALNAYAAFLAGGGLPSGYTAADLETLAQYIDALARSGQLAALLGANADLLEAYFEHLAAGGAVDRFAGLPVYATYVTALQAYYAYLDGGGLPAGYTALSQAQIQAYLAALAAAGGFNAQLGTLSDFFTAYYAFVAAGGNPANFAGLPVYADYQAALEAYYAFLAGGGLPSAYTLLTQAQIRAYLEALSGAGILTAQYTGEQLEFILALLTYLQTGADPDDFAELPVNNQPATLLAGANVWIFSNEGGRVGPAPTADVADSGQIRRTDYNGGTVVSYDYTGPGNILREHGRAGNNVAWTRYERGDAGFGITNQNVHLLIGSPATHLPASGTVDYKLIGGTAPTNSFAPAGEIGSFTGDLAVAFGATPKVGLEFDVHVGTRGWHAETPGGAAGAATGGLAVGSTMTFQHLDLTRSGIAGNACTGYCNVQVYGGLFGAGAANAGFQYFIDDQSSGGRSYVNGTAVFGTTGTELTRIGTMPAGGSEVREGQRFAYANPLIGDDAYASVQVTYDGNGIPIGYRESADETLSLGTLELFDEGSAGGVVAWARWADGTPSGNYYGSAPEAVGPAGGYHVVAGAPLTNMPASGTVRYDLVGFTQPTRHTEDVTTGSVSGGAAVVFGAAPKVALDLTVTSGADSFAMFTAGRLDDPGQSTLALASNGLFQSGASSPAVILQTSSSFCAPGCATFVEGFLAGDGASHMGLSYSIRSNGIPNRFIDGTAAFEAAASAPQVATGSYTDQRLLHLTYATFDTQYHSTVTYDANGVITSWTRDNGSLNSVGQPGPAAESGGIDDAIGWSRWLDTSNFASNAPNLANTGRHLVSGTPATNLPASGTVAYELIGQTKPTDRAGNLEPGDFTGTLAVDFATRKVGFDFNVAIDTYGWNMKTTGGSANPNDGGYDISLGNGFAGTPVVTGTTAASCTTTCFGSVEGALFGAGASHVGAGYMISDAATGVIVSGVGAFGRP